MQHKDVESNSEKQLSVIIVNYNTNRLTCQCIASIYHETNGIDLEIIVVDNDSPSEDAVEIVEAFPEVRLICNPKNEGFGRANNLGMAQARGEYILLLNSDCIVEDRALEKCFAFMESGFAKENNIGLLGCKLVYEDGMEQNSTYLNGNIWEYFTTTNPILNQIRRKVFKSNKFEPNQEGFVVGVSGAFMWFRAEVLKATRGFDPDFFMYSEETNLCRKRLPGIAKAYYWRGTYLTHLEGKSGKSDLMHLQSMVSGALEWYKWGVPSYCLLILFNLCNWLTLLITLPFISSRNRGQAYKQWLGIKHLLPYWLYHIPRYGRGWGSRPEPLKIRALRS